MPVVVASTYHANGAVMRSTGYLDAEDPTLAAYFASMAELGYTHAKVADEDRDHVLCFAEAESGELYLVEDAAGNLGYCLIRAE